MSVYLLDMCGCSLCIDPVSKLSNPLGVVMFSSAALQKAYQYVHMLACAYVLYLLICIDGIK